MSYQPSPDPEVPDFLVIGAQRSGTSFFYRALSAHPSVVRAARKELHYFDNRFTQGPAWYRAQLHADRACATGTRRLCGEATPYYLFHPLAPQRVAQVNPATRLIVLLREPGARAWSHYHYAVRLGLEQLSFTAAIAAEPERLAGEVERMLEEPSHRSLAHQHHSYLSRGRYVEQLRRWLEYFDPSQMLVLASETLFRRPREVVGAAVRFLGLPSTRQRVPRWRAGQNPTMPDQVRVLLDDYYRPHNREFCRLLEDVPVWRELGDGLPRVRSTTQQHAVSHLPGVHTRLGSER